MTSTNTHIATTINCTPAVYQVTSLLLVSVYLGALPTSWCGVQNDVFDLIPIRRKCY